MVFSSYDTLEPRDLGYLRKVLDDVCSEKKLSIDHPDVQSIARELVNWYLFGVREPEELKSMLGPLVPE